jgi:hypothetical protein
LSFEHQPPGPNAPFIDPARHALTAAELYETITERPNAEHLATSGSRSAAASAGQTDDDEPRNDHAGDRTTDDDDGNHHDDGNA